jgi:hypothetical protein
MKLILTLYLLFTIFFNIQVTSAQILEEIDLPIIELDPDSLTTPVEKKCIPPCRKGFFCFEGQCVSKCNPPCPDGMDCGEDAECHPRATTILSALHEIQEISKVNTMKEIAQGAVIKINRADARVRILDTTFQCDGDLFLNIPVGDYDVYVDAPRFFINEEDLEVKFGTIDTIEVKLRPFQINAGMLLGASTMKEFSLLAGEANVGVDFSALIHTGITGTYIGPIDSKPVKVTNYGYRYIPDTLKEVWTELTGIGASFGYLGFKPIGHRLKFIPQIDIGYWKYDDQTYYLEKYSNGKSEYLDDLEHHIIRKYFVRPTLSIRFGERVFNLNGKISVYFGTGVPIATFMSGFEVDFPR